MATDVPFTRFSAELLKLGGAQPKTKVAGGSQTSTYDQRRSGELTAPPVSSVLGNGGVKGSVGSNTFSAIQGYFESRGASKSNAQTMALLIVDTGKSLNVSPMQLLENQFGTQTMLRPSAYSTLNDMRTASDQQSLVRDINNAKANNARQIIA